MATNSHASNESHLDSISPAEPKTKARKATKRLSQTANAHDILLFIVAFRILNALTIQTFFQPDEYFQSLEPAWQMAFGKDSGAWITWEWNNHLRSALHPALFALLYRVVDLVASICKLSPILRADVLLAAPKTLQAVIAALSDYYTWRLAQRIYGQTSNEAAAALALSVASPWQWFCSTRTLSNCLETTLTVIAFYYWPWQWATIPKGTAVTAPVDGQGLRLREEEADSPAIVDETTRLRRSLILAALATVLRPTNVLIWVSMALMTILNLPSITEILRSPPWTAQTSQPPSPLSFFRVTKKERIALLKQAIICGSCVLILEIIVDRLYYQVWTLPPLHFLYFNVIQSLAVFYGRNDWHYYFSQGYPLLLTTALPWALVGIYHALRSEGQGHPRSTTRQTLSQLAVIVLLVPILLSQIYHKEVRFIYPILPLLHILSAEPLSTFFTPSLVQGLDKRLRPPRFLVKRILLLAILALNIMIGLYTTTIHNSGIIHVLSYLRQQHETYYDNSNPPQNLTAAFLMPCHSTPWRSQLLYPPSASQPGISAWALTCEPPLHLNSSAKASYLDEADVFYADPLLWLRKNMVRDLPRSPRGQSIFVANAVPRRRGLLDHCATNAGGREWPEYLIFFEHLQSLMHTAFTGSGYRECWRGFNTRWHDDRRRTGDVIVWCLSPRRSDQQERRKSVWNLLDPVHNIARLAMGQTEEITRGGGDVDHDGREKMIGGAWGHSSNGEDVSQVRNREPLAAGESAMERNFWKIRAVEPFKERDGVWSWIWPKPKKRRWWQRSMWS